VERALLWFKCAAMHDPVRPVIKKPAVLGWEAKQRRVDLVIERPLRGDELLKRMKGWFTADVYQVADIIKPHAKLKVIDDIDLVVETNTLADLKALEKSLIEAFGEEVWIEPVTKTRLE
jgi:hypothetical protein